MIPLGHPHLHTAMETTATTETGTDRVWISMMMNIMMMMILMIIIILVVMMINMMMTITI